MNILKDMELFVRVVQCDGLAAAGRELGMTPSSVTTRIKNLESHYQVKLLSRTTRAISLTDSGRDFYHDSLKVLEEIYQVENKLTSSRNVISGPLRITATSDLGRQHICAVVNEFVTLHPDVEPFLDLNDSITDITNNNIDIAIRYGISPFSQLITHKLASSRRVLCASPDYIKRAGTPQTHLDLKNHSCLAMVQIKTPMTKWYFATPQGEKSITIQPSRSCTDGAQIRQWALEGAGIGLKSYWDVVNDLKTKRLVTVLDEFKPNYQSNSLAVDSNLYVAYLDRKYIPNRTREFLNHLKGYFDNFTRSSQAGHY